VSTGIIKRVVNDKGFGFIKGDDGREYFFHRSGTSAMFESLREGQDVTFEEEPSAKGPRATDVRTVERH
jgi:CspA family cold shock protein